MTSLVWNDKVVRGLILDMDGVVVNSRAAHQESWRRFIEEENLPVDPEEFLLKIFGQGKNDNIPLAFGRDDLQQAFIDEKAARIEQGFLQLMREGKVPPVPGVLDFLRDMKARGLALCLGTSAPRENLELVVEKFELAPLLDATVSEEDVLRTKPAPDIFLKCCERLALPAEECVVFEDSIHGMTAAREAGCRVVGLATTHPREKLLPHCEICVADFEELRTAIPWAVNKNP